MGKLRNAELLLLSLALLMAAFLRFYRLDSVPSGVFVDVAYNGLDIQEIFRGNLPIFFVHNNGREPLFIYFQAGLAAVVGLRPILFAFSSIFMGLLGTAASYRLSRAMFGRSVALIATALLGTSFWFLAINRIGLRSNSLPLFMAAAVYLLWRTLRTGRPSYAVLGGVALGLSQYTYSAARLLPPLFVLFCLADYRVALKRWRLLLVFAGIAFLCFLPEGLYFVQHKEELFLRVAQISTLTNDPSRRVPAQSPLDHIVRFEEMFFLDGDPSPLQNIPDQPVFWPPLAVFFVGGLLISIWRSLRIVSYRWLLLWVVVMSIPGAFTIDTPDSLRVLSLAPATFVIPAVGLAFVSSTLHLANLVDLGIAILLVLSPVQTFEAYFGRWANDPENLLCIGHAGVQGRCIHRPAAGPDNFPCT